MFVFLGLELWFWLCIIAFSATMFWSAEYDHSGWATVDLVAILLYMQFLTPYHPWEWIRSHPIQLVEYAAAYVVVGIVWCFAKWWFFVNAAARWTRGAIEEQRLIGGKRTTVASLGYHDKYKSLPPQASQHVNRIMFWMIYWPFSAVWTIINDPVMRFFRWVFNLIKGILQQISNRAFKDIPYDNEPSVQSTDEPNQRSSGPRNRRL